MSGITSGFIFADQWTSNAAADEFLLVVPRGLKGKEALLLAFARVGRFPEYFGANWDALIDCLLDFSWVQQSHIVIRHEDIPELSDKELRTYLEILRHAVEIWQQPKEGPIIEPPGWMLYVEHKLSVILPARAKETVSRTLNAVSPQETVPELAHRFAGDRNVGKVAFVDVAAELARRLVGNRLLRVQRGEHVWFFVFANEVGLTVECPWRIIVDGRIAHGGEDHAQQFGLPAPIDGADKSNRLMQDKSVREVTVRPDTGDLTITFEDGTALEVLNMSSGYEGWQFYANGWNLIAMGGGQLAIFESKA